MILGAQVHRMRNSIGLCRISIPVNQYHFGFEGRTLVLIIVPGHCLSLPFF